MDKKNKYSIYLAFAGVILLLIAFFSPTNIPHGYTDYVWIWGLRGRKEFSILFLDDDYPRLTIISLICSAIIIISIFIGIIQIYKNNKYPENSKGLMWLILGGAIIAAIIFWSISIHYLLLLVDESSRRSSRGGVIEIKFDREYTLFWDYNYIGFGIILAIIGASLLIIAGILKGLKKSRN